MDLVALGAGDFFLTKLWNSFGKTVANCHAVVCNIL